MLNKVALGRLKPSTLKFPQIIAQALSASSRSKTPVDLPVRTIPPSLVNEIHVDWDKLEVYGPADALSRPAFREWIANLLEVASPPIILKPVPTALTEVANRRRDSLTATINSIAPLLRGTASFDRMMTHIQEAAAFNSSDLHLHRVAESATIQFRLDGSIVDTWELTTAEADSLAISTMQGIATDRTQGQFNFSEFQDAKVEGGVLDGTGVLNIRVVRGPCHPVQSGGHYMSLRLHLDKNVTRTAALPAHVMVKAPRIPTEPVMFEKMGFTKDQISKIHQIITAPHGMVLNTGPTGSGKTTTQYESCKLKKQIDPGRRLITIEQPVEIPMFWGVQLSATDETFDRIMACVLRSDPDDIVVQEIQKLKVARIAMQCALSGHFVNSTMHVNHPFAYMDRFESFDSQEFSYKSIVEKNIIRGVIAQRLIPVLCPHCSVPWTRDDPRIDEVDKASLANWGDVRDLRQIGPGCAHCRQGRIGQKAVAEVVTVDSALNRDFLELGVDRAKTRYRQRENSDRPMIVSGLQGAFDGQFDPRDIRQKIGILPVSPDHVMRGDFEE
ncbi:GspE/PulE family protein [Asaia spathodeae]|uniref:Flp pilus assembly complex ATPase component TadA n=1 Tax=Asaia spathodeae TaxID=657016 RepID=A0ABX2P9L8_9PROT|nr:ATPase, T2SS/T4P/T4SS family [Asaia spathodeae]GBR16845.1 type II secretion system protein PilB [Asaia spathodeae NBRC 105894]